VIPLSRGNLYGYYFFISFRARIILAMAVIIPAMKRPAAPPCAGCSHRELYSSGTDIVAENKIMASNIKYIDRLMSFFIERIYTF